MQSLQDKVMHQILSSLPPTQKPKPKAKAEQRSAAKPRPQASGQMSSVAPRLGYALARVPRHRMYTTTEHFIAHKFVTMPAPGMFTGGVDAT